MDGTMSNHLSWETINDLVDDLLPQEDREAASRHVSDCAECRGALEALDAAMTAARTAPAAMTPPDDLWGNVRATIESRKVAHLAGRPATPRGWWITTPRLVAAGLALVVGTSAITALAVRGRAPDPALGSQRIASLPVAWQAAERGYQASVLELRVQLATMHDEFAPATILAVEQSLATIDVAIAEAREALLRDPANAALPELLASNYRQKIDLLRRATQIPSSS
jgi:hypothetical protein